MKRITIKSLKDLLKSLEKFDKEIYTLEVSAPYFYTKETFEKMEKGVKLLYWEEIEVVDVELKIKKIEGFEYLGKFEQKDGIEVASFENTVPQIQDKYHCDHCNTNRQRKTVYIFKKEDGTFFRIASSCVVKYFGIQGEKIISAMHVHDAFLKSIEANDDFENCVVKTFRLEDIIATGLYYNMSFTNAKEDMGFTYRNIQSAETRQEEVNMVKAFVESLDQFSSDWAFNLKQIINNERITEKHIGLVWSASVAFLKNQVKQKLLNKKDGFVGKVGDKMEMELTFVSMVSFESNFGMTRIYKFLTKEGQVIVWKTSTLVNFDKHSPVKAKFTVKEHSVYKEEQQTLVLRLKIQ